MGGGNGRPSVSDLIDTTEMYLRTVYELREEGVVPLRARIAERLQQSGPTVSQTVARMERDGLLVIKEDRHIELTPLGELQAVRVMRKHRLAERLLVDVIGLDWETVHDEACRWEHVMSDAVERRLLALLDHPTESPFGNPIPGLSELDPQVSPPQPVAGTSLGTVVGDEQQRYRVLRIAEWLQEQPQVMAALAAAGVRPGAEITARRTATGEVAVSDGRAVISLTADQADRILVAN
jgi:DtxR family Mn-dependent transcriptional regulator